MMGEYDAGYENCIDSMVRQMEDMQYRIDCLHAENAKLREQLEYDRQTSRSRLESIDRLKTENAKLRELVRRLVYATHPADRATLIANAAELGVEVDA